MPFGNKTVYTGETVARVSLTEWQHPVLLHSLNRTQFARGQQVDTGERGKVENREK